MEKYLADRAQLYGGRDDTEVENGIFTSDLRNCNNGFIIQLSYHYGKSKSRSYWLSSPCNMGSYCPAIDHHTAICRLVT